MNCFKNCIGSCGFLCLTAVLPTVNQMLKQLQYFPLRLVETFLKASTDLRLRKSVLYFAINFVHKTVNCTELIVLNKILSSHFSNLHKANFLHLNLWPAILLINLNLLELFFNCNNCLKYICSTCQLLCRCFNCDSFLFLCWVLLVFNFSLAFGALFRSSSPQRHVHPSTGPSLCGELVFLTHFLFHPLLCMLCCPPISLCLTHGCTLSLSHFGPRKLHSGIHFHLHRCVSHLHNETIAASLLTCHCRHYYTSCHNSHFHLFFCQELLSTRLSLFIKVARHKKYKL